MSLQQTPEQSENLTVHTELKQEWIAKLKELQQVQVFIHEIDNRFKSFGLTAREAIGLALDDVKQEQDLFFLDNHMLSKNDLTYKKELLCSKQLQLTAELKSLRAVVKQLEVSARAKKAAQQAELLRGQQQSIIERYNKDPVTFLDDVLFEIPLLSLKNKEEIYLHADQIVAIGGCLSESTSRPQLWAAWKLVAKARDLATDNLIGKYNTEARQFFIQLITKLPAGMQGLKILYDAKDYDRADYYLSEVYTTRVSSDPKEYLHLLQDMAEELEIASKTIVRVVLSSNPEFNKLSKKHKNWLIEQHAYMHRLRYDLSFANAKEKIEDLDKFVSNAALLDEILRCSMYNHRKFSECEQRFDLVKKLQIFKSNPAASCKIGLGSGLGSGWLLGSDSLTPEDYRFIRNEDDYWDLNFAFNFGVKDLKSIKPSLLVRAKQTLRKYFNSDIPSLYPARDLLAIDKLSPGLGAQLFAYFQHRANDIKLAVEHAISINNQAAAEFIKNDLAKLEQDWQEFTAVADQPAIFCTLVNEYLDRRYKVEREQYLATTQIIKNCYHELSKANKQVNFETIDDLPEQRSIKELHDLKGALRRIRINT